MDASGPLTVRHSSRDELRSSGSAGGTAASSSQALPTAVASLPPASPIDAPGPLAGLGLCDWPELQPGALSGDPEVVEAAETPCDVKIVLGRAALGTGAARLLPDGQIVVLDSAAQAPVEIWSGGQLVARGQLRTLDGHYCVQVNELLHPPARKRRP